MSIFNTSISSRIDKALGVFEKAATALESIRDLIVTQKSVIKETREALLKEGETLTIQEQRVNKAIMKINEIIE